MNVYLPRSCNGREVIDAFEVAVSFQESSSEKWEAWGFEGGMSNYRLDTLQNTRSRGVRVTRYTLKKRWIICGKKIWRKDHLANIILLALDPFASYSWVSVAFEYDCGDAGEGTRYC